VFHLECTLQSPLELFQYCHVPRGKGGKGDLARHLVYKGFLLLDFGVSVPLVTLFGLDGPNTRCPGRDVCESNMEGTKLRASVIGKLRVVHWKGCARSTRKGSCFRWDHVLGWKDFRRGVLNYGVHFFRFQCDACRDFGVRAFQLGSSDRRENGPQTISPFFTKLLPVGVCVWMCVGEIKKKRNK